MNPSSYRSLHNQCQECDSLFNLLVHHIDEDRTNNTKENFRVLCTSCHAVVHQRIKNIKKMRFYYITHHNQLTFGFYNG